VIGRARLRTKTNKSHAEGEETPQVPHLPGLA
jgi:hypothetical protein